MAKVDVQNSVNPFFSEAQIAEWNSEFLLALENILNNQELIYDAIIQRGGLYKKSDEGLVKLSHDEVKEALKALDAGDNSLYKLTHPSRVIASLSRIGFTQSQIDRMSLSQKMIIASAVFTAIPVNIDAESFKLILQDETKTLEITDYKITLINNLHPIAMPLAKKLVLNQREGLKLLEDTLDEKSSNATALGRLLLAMDKGELTINGQLPDNTYSLGEYVIHGGRIKFDISELSPEEQQEFFEFVTNNVAEPRAFATHRAGGTDASGSPAEAKSGLLGAIEDAFRYVLGRSKHYGINIAVGGAHIENKEGNAVGENPAENGEWGHIYLHQDDDMVMFGIEGSAPGKSQKRTGDAHSKTGAASEYSPFLEMKIDSAGLHETQTSPISTRNKYNWASVKVSHKAFTDMKTEAAGFEAAGASYTGLVHKTPDNAEKPSADRQEKMQAWAKATKDGNKKSLLSIIAGLFLIGLGIAIALTPIPGVSQAVGAGIAAFGGALALVGAAVVVSSSQENPEKAQKIYEKKLSKMPEPAEQPVNYNGSNVGMAAGLHVVKPNAPVQPASPVVNAQFSDSDNERSDSESDDEDIDLKNSGQPVLPANCREEFNKENLKGLFDDDSNNSPQSPQSPQVF